MVGINKLKDTIKSNKYGDIYRDKMTGIFSNQNQSMEQPMTGSRMRNG